MGRSEEQKILRKKAKDRVPRNLWRGRLHIQTIVVPEEKALLLCEAVW